MTLPPPNHANLTAHAVERYQERVRPSLTVEQCRVELGRLRHVVTWQNRKPEWHRGGEYGDRYMVIGEDVAFPCVYHAGCWVATTCLTRPVQRKHHHHKSHRKRRQRRPYARVYDPALEWQAGL